MKKYSIKLQNIICRMLCVCAFILFAQSCSQDKVDISQINLYNEIIEGNGIVFDSTMSKEKKQAYKKLLEVVSENLKLQDNKLVFMDKEEFLSKGFPETLYDKFAVDLESINILIAKDSSFLNTIKEELPVQMAKMKKKLSETNKE
ncbi:MAG: hypothetical protein LBS55_08470 [Prevotellaceae bacterium]|jgi:hypothetical protein|nr:hypothetical protein [Prevotellaceae bacterium]